MIGIIYQSTKDVDTVKNLTMYIQLSTSDNKITFIEFRDKNPIDNGSFIPSNINSSRFCTIKIIYRLETKPYCNIFILESIFILRSVLFKLRRNKRKKWGNILHSFFRYQLIFSNVSMLFRSRRNVIRQAKI